LEASHNTPLQLAMYSLLVALIDSHATALNSAYSLHSLTPKSGGLLVVNKRRSHTCTSFSLREAVFAVEVLAQYDQVPWVGHSANAGFASTNGGVLMSFQGEMAAVTHDTDTMLAQMRPGRTGVEIEEALDPYDPASLELYPGR
jgi:hypothetical protein